VAIQGTAATLVPSTFAKKSLPEARNMADRIFVWGTLIGAMLGLTQYLMLPLLIPLFSTLPNVQNAARIPAVMASVLHLINGPVFAGEGTMLGMGHYRDLALITAFTMGINVALINSPLGNQLQGILLSMAIYCFIQAICVIFHHFKVGTLSRRAAR
jgi:Na+-driven multidrug efflux pump